MSTARTNPYVGPTAFEAGDPLHGRAQARDELLDLLIAERVVLLHSPSGAGKTSLIQAALVAALEEAGFEVLPVVRVTHAVDRRHGAVEGRNRYLLSTLLSLEEGVPPELQHPVEELARMRLVDYLDARPDLDGRPGNEVLVFDQFEEVLTADPTDDDEKREFFADLGAALRDRHHWALFAMREDYLAALDPYVRHIPTRFRTRYRLDLLTAEQATEAVVQPAADAGVRFSPAAAAGLVDDLRRVRVQRPDGTVEVLGPYVEPVQLQVACHLLWSRLAPGTTEITATDGTAPADVEEALGGYYAQRVHEAAERAGVPEGVVRDWFEDRLITPQGLRGQVLEGPLAGGAGDRELLGTLVGAHLVRPESRRQATWYELSHDRFIEPVKRDNAAWRASHLTGFERAALVWDHEGRPERLLLTGAGLAEAVQQATGRLGEREQAFLALSQRAEERRLRDLRTAARLRRLARGLGVASVVGLVLLVTSVVFLAQARRASAEAETEERRSALLAAVSRDVQWDTERAVTLADALARSLPEDAWDDDVWTALALAAGDSPVLVAFQGHTEPVAVAAVSGDGGTVATSERGRVRVFDRATGEQMHDLRLPTGTEVVQLGLDDDGSTLAAGGAAGEVIAWDLASGTSRVWSDGTEAVWGLAVAPDGERVATAGYRGALHVWSTATGEEVARAGDPRGALFTLTWSEGGDVVAGVGLGPDAVVWDASTGEEVHRVPTGGPSLDVRLSPDGTRVATTDVTWRTVVHDVATGAVVAGPLAGRGEVHRAITPDLAHVVSTQAWGEVTLVDVTTGDTVAEAYVGGADLVGAVQDPQDADAVVVLPAEGDPSVWSLSPASTLLAARRYADRAVAVWEDGRVRVEVDGVARWSTTDVTVGVVDVDVDEDARRVLAVTASGGVVVQELPSASTAARPALGDSLGGGPPVAAAAPASGALEARFLPGGESYAVLDDLGAVTAWDAATGERERVLLDGLWTFATSLDVSPSGALVVTYGADQPFAGGDAVAPPRDAVVLDQDGGRVALDVARGATGPDRTTSADGGVVAGAVDASGTRVALVTGDGAVQVLDAGSGDVLHEQGLTVQAPSAITFADDEHLLVTGEREVWLLTADGGTPPRRIAYSETVQAAGLAPDGDVVVADWRGARIELPVREADLASLLRSKVVRDLTPDECERFPAVGC